MGTNKRFDGYHAYDYLDDEAYEQFEFDEPYSGFEPFEVDLDEEQEARVKAIEAGTLISLHDHAFYYPKDVEGDLWPYVREGRMHTAYEALSETALDAVFDMHCGGLSWIHSKHGWKWDDIVTDLGLRACDHDHSEYVIRCRSLDDIERAHDEGRLAIIAAIESSAMIENELDRIDQLYGMGVRCMGLTYNASNAVGTGQGDIHERDGGLTGFGASAIERMNDVGMAISTSHASRQTTLDACAVTDQPIFDTHTYAQAKLDRAGRSASDEELIAIAETGGVIGIVASAHLPSIDAYMEHFEYVVDLVGIDHVAFGPDITYGDHVGLLEVLADFHGIDLPASATEHSHVVGLENPTEAWTNLPRRLVKDGYSDSEIEQVLSGNILRVLDEVWV